MDHAAVPEPCLACRRRTHHRICQGCRARTDENLHELPALYNQLATAMIPGSVVGDRVSGSRTAPLPGRLEPLSLRAAGGIVAYLTDWEDSWRQELNWSPRPFRGSIDQTITGVIKFLRVNWPWAADSHPVPECFVSEIGALVRQCRLQIEGPSDYKQIGHCPTMCDDDLPCATTLWANPWLDQIRCRGCDSIWHSEHWLVLGRAMRQDLQAAP